MIIQPNKNSIKMLIIENLNSGKLILIEPDVRHVGKDQALVEVAKQTGIPIFATREQAYFLNRIAGCPVAWYTEIDIIEKGQEVGFLVDEGIPLLRVISLKNTTLQPPEFRLRTGFYTNDIFNRDVIFVQECEDDGCGCGCPTPQCPTPQCPTPQCPTPQPDSPTPQT
jgi:hypothetical protein